MKHLPPSSGTAHRPEPETLFTQKKQEWPPAHRLGSPETSIEAEETINRDGTRLNQTQAVYEALIRHNGSTAKELAYIMNCPDVNTPHRRLNDLAEMEPPKAFRGPARICGKTHRKATTWWVMSRAGVPIFKRGYVGDYL